MSTTSNQSSTALVQREVQMDRVIKEVIAPPMYPLGSDKVFNPKTGLPNLPVLKEHLQREGRLTLDAALSIVKQASILFKTEPNLLELKYPITVCGDLHGQFFDLLRLFEVGGDPSSTQYLFLGDYVDRGCFSSEVVIYLYAHKLVYPKTLFMLRGNHECRQLTSFFNFKDECVYKYNLQFYDAVMESFDQLPLAALINRAFFCVHGGLSPDVTSLEEIKQMDRFCEIPREGPMCDLLWSDPYEEDQTNPLTASDASPDAVGVKSHASQESTQWFNYNETRQCSYIYGIEAVKQFLKDNKLTSVIRAHEAQLDGYKMQMINKSSGIPRVITIFSAPNYCDVYKNKAACLKFDNNVLNIKQFIDSAHPYYLPNFMDVFQWSLPFVAEKVTDMLANVLEWDEQHPDAMNDVTTDQQSIVQQRGGLLKKKVVAVTKLLRMYKVLRQEHENILALKQLTPSHKVPFGLLTKGSEAIQQVLSSFEQAKTADSINEKMPNTTKSQSPPLAARKFSQSSSMKPLSLNNSNQPSSPPENQQPIRVAVTQASPTSSFKDKSPSKKDSTASSSSNTSTSQASPARKPTPTTGSVTPKNK